jgi:hypothetical protein
MLTALIVSAVVFGFCAIVLVSLFTLVAVFSPVDFGEALDGDLLGEED